MIKAIGFDLDGTLYKNNKVIDDVIKIAFIKEVQKSIDLPYDKIRKMLQKNGSGRKTLEELGFKNAREKMNEIIATANVSKLLKPNKELNNFLQKLSSEYFVFLITSSPKEASLKKLKSLEINPEIFEHQSFSDSHNAGKKSAGEPFKTFLLKYNYLPREILFVGDREHSDIIPCKDLGIKTAHIGSSAFADHNIKEIIDLKDILNRNKIKRRIF